MARGPLAVVPAWRWWLGFFVIVGVALYLTWIAYAGGLPELFDRPYVDKLAHFALAGLLAFFLDGALRRKPLSVAGVALVPLSAACVLAPVGIEEYLQRYGELRNSSLWDFAADVAGVALLIPLSRRSAQ